MFSDLAKLKHRVFFGGGHCLNEVIQTLCDNNLAESLAIYTRFDD